MKRPARPRWITREAALHEAGHAVMAHLCGWRVMNLDLTRRDNQEGCVHFHGNRFCYLGDGRFGQYLLASEYRAALCDASISLAGGAAERIAGIWDWHDGSGKDWGKTGDLLEVLYIGPGEITPKEKDRRTWSLWFQVKGFLQKPPVWRMVRHVQRSLLAEFDEHRVWGRSEILSILQAATAPIRDIQIGPRFIDSLMPSQRFPATWAEASRLIAG